uniref:Ferritin-like domain-containing protein n=1 Tax=Globodera pallida TaxID=36090 RepID=A0A183CT37_GLOPA
MVVGLDLEKLKQVKLDDDVHKNSTSMEEKDLEDRRIDDAIKFIKETEQEHRGIISALFKQSGLAGLKGQVYCVIPSNAD